jgi:outer membrane biosynthesis protein TonB
MKVQVCIAISVAVIASALAETPVRIEPEMLASCVRPQYPYEARSRQIQGQGLFQLSINPQHRVSD